MEKHHEHHHHGCPQDCLSEHHEHHEHHHHEHGEGGLRRQLLLIVATTVLLAGAVVVEKHCALPTWQLLLVYLVPYLLIGHETLKEAAEGVAHGDWFNEHFLMSVATIGALAIGFLPGAETQFPEAVFVMLFFQVGELFEGYAEGQSRKSISHLMDIRPDVAHAEQEGEALRDVHPDEVAVGSIIVVRPGEKVPLDGVIVEGTTTLNTMALTGESAPRDATVGDEVVSGCVNQQGMIRMRTTKAYGESTVAKIIDLVEHAAEHKSRSEAFISRFARIYTPIVVLAAVVLAVVPPLVSTVVCHLSFSEALVTWLYRALMFLVVSCPCALVISVPLTFFAGIGGASRRGILVKGANYMDVLARVGTVVFDKTGTLTHGQFVVEAVHPDSYSPHQLLHLAAHVEHYSTHPIGAALRDAFPDEATDGCVVSDVAEVAGQGIRARVGGRMVCVGNTKMMDGIGAQWHQCDHGDEGTVIHVAVDGQYAGHIIINDKVKGDSAAAIAALKAQGVTKTVMLTGDRSEVAGRVAGELGLDEWHAGLLPADKVKFIDDLRIFDLPFDSSADSSERSQIENRKSSLRSQIENRKSVNRKSSVVFVGDGINDAPVLARADVGMAMGGLGSDAAIEAADVVIMDDKPSKVSTAIAIARRTIAIARQNVWFAIGVKVAVLVLALFGVATMWMAVFADVGVTVLAVLNAMRALS